MKPVSRLWLTFLLVVVLALFLQGCSSGKEVKETSAVENETAVEAETVDYTPQNDVEAYYKEVMPGKFKMWKESAHGRNGVTCSVCHEDLKDNKLPAEKLVYNGEFDTVKPETCAKCHQKEYEGWKNTRHVQAVEFSKKNVRYHLLDGYPAMQVLGCKSCHEKVAKTCSSCHTVHSTELPKPPLNITNGCENCHMGPDHPQREAFESSKHHQVALATGEPTCITCHTTEENRHEIFRIKGTEDHGRTKMLQNCQNCHSREFAEDALAKVDEIKKETNRIIDEARKIIQGLYRDGILKPSPGSLLDENGMPMLNAKGTSYSHVSHIESLMFELFKYAGATAIKGAQHFAPDYAHWHGNADLWQKYLEIKNEAERLRLEAKLKEKLGIETEEYPMFKYSQETGKELQDLN
ncbi:multiheme c-type cytochrome [Calderihabitans maritimus]|uniref:Uncharacterized protein n=1 Tax=Calderihabitans maritimus TaxID=1246530 RepID=A0A1Z5HT69_9FIRM|nr:multiheme c-type cytochrome [Calderihabitans maritimus]GAW92714.1 hypothetical protein Gura_1628 [Calderihabitans maritimus]